MAFRLTQSPTYTWPVRITIPADGGKQEVCTFDAEFRRLNHDRIRELVQAMQRYAKGEMHDDDPTDVEAAAEVLAGWKGVVDDAGKEVPFSQEALDQMLQIPFLASQLLTEWAQSQTEAKRKN